LDKKTVLVVISVLVIVIVAFSLLTVLTDPVYSNKTKHETNRWTVIADSKGDVIAVETSDSKVWDTLTNLQENQTEMWIGGIVEEYDNYWGFRFNPDTIVIAEITIEGAQSNIKAISEDLNYWINTWQKQAYVFAKVTAIHE
jgi:hypothetical protein